MKIAVLNLIIVSAFLNFSCGRNVESSPVSVIEKPAETPQPVSTPDKYEEIDIIEQFSTMAAENEPAPLNFGDYKIETVKVKKYEKDSPEAEIYDAILSYKGKPVRRLEGVYYPLGNFMSFGLYPFLKGSEKQLFVIEESNRFDHAYIFNLSPKFEVLFDAEDFDVLYGYLQVIDIDNDGEKEITLSNNCQLGFNFTNVDQPWVRIIFKYDPAARKYLPASHKFTDYTFKELPEQIKKLNEKGDKNFADVLEIFMTYVYAGQENQAWQFLDETLSNPVKLFGENKDKAEIKLEMKEALNKDPIYKFIRRDLTGKK